MSKRVLIFSLAYLPKMVGGAEIAIKEITDRLGSEYSFDMVTLRFDSTLPQFEKIGNVNVHRIGWSRANPSAKDLVRFPLYLLKVWYPIGAYLKARKLAKTTRYDIVWAMMSYMGFPALFFKWKFPKTRFVLTLQEGDRLDHVTGRARIRIVGPLYRRIFKKADVVQTISTYLAEFARKMGFYGEVAVVPNGVDVSKFSALTSEAKVDELRSSCGFSESDIVLVTTSRLVEKNAVGDIISSLTFLEPHTKLLVIGTGPLEAELKTLSDQLELAERVKFIGYVEQEKIPAYLHACDIFVRPSRSEGMGNSFIEAMAAGIPVIATAVGGITDFLKDGETGLEVGLRDTAADIARKVKKLTHDNESRDYIVKNARALVEKKYQWSLVAREMKDQVFK